MCSNSCVGSENYWCAPLFSEPRTKCRKVGAYSSPLLLICTSFSFRRNISLTAITASSSFFYYFSTFPSPLLFSYNRGLRLSSCYGTSSDQSLGFHSFKSSRFQRAISFGGRVNRNLNQCVWTARPPAPARYTPTAPAEEGGSERERERGGEGLSNTHHT